MPELRTVKDGETAPPPPPKDVAEAAKRGTRRELLVAMRDRIAEAVADPKCPPRDLSSLTLRLDKIATEIEQMDRIEREAAGKGGPVSDGDFDPASV